MDSIMMAPSIRVLKILRRSYAERLKIF
jgi:hypothetical protein